MGVDAVVVAAGSSRRMGGIDKLTAIVAGRPLLAWSVGGDGRVAPLVDRVVLVVAPDRVAEVAAADWLPAGTAVVAGGDTRQASVAAGVRHLDRVDPDGGDRPVLVHDGARPLVVGGAGRGGRRRGRPARGGDPRRCPWPRRSSGSTAGGSSRPSTAPGSPPRRRPRARAAGCCSRPGTGSRPTGRPSFTDEAALLEACTITVHAIPGEPSNLKVTLPDDLTRVEQLLARRRAAGRVRPRQPPVRARVSAPPRRHRDRRRARARRPLRRRRRAARGRRRAARRGGPGRPRAPVPQRRAHAARHRQRACCCATSSRGWPRAGLRPASVDVTIIGARPRLGRPPRRDAGGDRRRARPRRGARQRQGVDRQPGGRRGGGPDDLGAGRRHGAGRAHDDPPAGHAHAATSGRSTRSSPARSASTAAARRSTARPTSATSARSCSPTCWCATCATRAWP